MTEVMVSIFGIALLLGLLVGVSARMRESTNRIRCVSNLREISAAIHLYAQEHSGDLPGPTSISYDSRYTRNLVATRTHLTHFLIPYLHADPTTNTVAYLPQFICPGAARLMPASEFQNGRPGKCYTQTRTMLPTGRTPYPFGNRENGQETPDLPLKIQNIPDPAKTIALADMKATVSDYPVHGNLRNFLFFDGSVRSIAVGQIRSGIELLDDPFAPSSDDP